MLRVSAPGPLSHVFGAARDLGKKAGLGKLGGVTPLCSCGAPLVCTRCETCPEHCRRKDPIACAWEAAEFSEKTFGADDPRTRTAREQLEEARLEMWAKDAAERSAEAVRAFREGSGQVAKTGQKPN